MLNWLTWRTGTVNQPLTSIDFIAKPMPPASSTIPSRKSVATIANKIIYITYHLEEAMKSVTDLFLLESKYGMTNPRL
jgi:hypothetical protein